MRRMLVDASAFITLAEIGKVELLRDIGELVRMPDAVVEEIQGGVAAAILDEVCNGWIGTYNVDSNAEMRNEIADARREAGFHLGIEDVEEEGEGEGVQTALDWSWFTEFLGTYTYMSTSEDGLDSEEHELEQSARTLNKTLTQALKGWSGDVIDGDYIEFVDGIKTPEYRFLAKWANPRVNLEVSRERTRREPTPGQLWFVLEPEGATVDIPVPINFELYILMNRIRKGYTPNARDLERSEGIRLIHSRLSEFTNKKETVRILDKVGSELLRLEEDAFGGVIVGSGGNR